MCIRDRYEPVNGIWNLDEGKGNTITDTEGKYIGTFQGEVGWIDGVKGKALDVYKRQIFNIATNYSSYSS